MSPLLTLIWNEEKTENPLYSENDRQFYMGMPEISFLDEFMYLTTALWIKKKSVSNYIVCVCSV